MKLVCREITDWPKLAWVAVCPDKSHTLEILHGRCVEVNDNWCVEAAWAGPFALGDFDLTDLVFGTGIRRRDSEVIFVSSGSPMDRLFYCKDKGRWFFSNSFPALLAVSGLTLLDNYRYENDLRSIKNGLNRYVQTIPLKHGQASIVYFNNLVFDGSVIREIDKPDSAWDFSNFDDYFDYLKSATERIRENLRASERSHQVIPFATISSGYDSPVGAILARHAGCRHSATLRSARAMVKKRVDSGEAIAKHLNLECQVYRGTATEIEHEEYVWAVSGKPDDLNLTIFDYPEPLTLLFTGFFGDKVWSCDFHLPLEKEPMIGMDLTGTGLSEFRLLKGVFHCPVPFWGIQHIGAIRRITSSAEMEPYTLHTEYDRPIPRRIIENTGVPRGSFAVRKSATSLDLFVRYPQSRKARESFKAYARSLGVPVPNVAIIKALRLINVALRLINVFDVYLLNKTLYRKGKWQSLHVGVQPKASSLLFHWAIHETTRQYQVCL